MTTTAVGVLASAPLPGRCKPGLLAAHSAEWVAGLHAAMLRDTLDGLQAIDAAHYVVFVADPGERADQALALETLARHVPAPWELVLQEGADRGARLERAFESLFARGASYVLVAASDAPSAPTEPLAAALLDGTTRERILVGPSDDGGHYVLGMPRVEPRLLHDMPWSTPALMETTRLRCREQSLVLHELPPWYDVDAPSDVMRLLDELRRHPERAPRSAQFLVTNA